MKIFILSRCMSADGLDAATLVFRTLWIGFPEAEATVLINAPTEELANTVLERLPKNAKGSWIDPKPIEHGTWIEALVETDGPFFICDTDVVFHDEFPVHEIGATHLAGDLTPWFNDPFTRCITAPRLHTSLLYVQPVKLRERIKDWREMVRPTRLAPVVNPFLPLVLPLHGAGTPVFFDTCALLYRAVGGTFFSQDALATYDHLHAGTWVDELETAMPGLKALHQLIYMDPSKARGLRVQQRQFYKEHA